MNIGDTFNLRADRDLTALDHECGRNNDLSDIVLREFIATVHAYGTSRAKHQRARNVVVAKHVKARMPDLRRVA